MQKTTNQKIVTEIITLLETKMLEMYSEQYKNRGNTYEYAPGLAKAIGIIKNHYANKNHQTKEGEES
jgi:hypothetical protein